MDRHKVMTLVQFWVVVDGMRNPLENKTTGVAAQPAESRGWSQTDRQDIFQISQAYIGKLELNVDSTVQRVVRTFLAGGSKATWEQYVSARQALLSVQDDVFLELNEKYFPGFRKSDLYYKWLASESSTPALTVISTPNGAIGGDNAWSSPMHPRRDGSQPAAARLKQPDLRRAIASSGDLPTTAMTALASHIHPRVQPLLSASGNRYVSFSFLLCACAYSPIPDCLRHPPRHLPGTSIQSMLLLRQHLPCSILP